jgi:foldase protein PrsA
MKKPRNVLALGAALLVTVALAACGNGVPSDSVAKVGDVDISKETFNHWAQIVQKAQATSAEATSTSTTVPDAPDFTKCIAEKKATAPAPAKGQPNPSDADYKAQCKQEYDALRDQVLQLLINGEWIQGEAHDLGLKLTDEKVRQALITQKDQSFPNKGDFEKFIKQTGYTTEDLLYRVKIGELTNKVRDKIIKGKDKVTDKDTLAYYNKNKQQFGQPASRDVNVVLTKTLAQANAAKKALEAGQSFKTVAKKYSIDDTSKANGGKLSGVTSGQLEKQLDKEVFAAKKSVIGGPVKTQFGYYVYEVTKITTGTQQSYEDVKDSIKSIVGSEKQQNALNAFVKKFEKKWRDETKCASGYKISICKNGPNTTATTTGVAPGAVPQPGGSSTTAAPGTQPQQ